MTEPNLRLLDVTLVDADEGYEDVHQRIRLAASRHGISLLAEGYGDYSSENGSGAPVHLELYQGELRLLVWADINAEEPTHIIPLGGAQENHRQPSQEALA